MNTKSHLEQARRYEFNAMQAEKGGDEQLAHRYEYMSKMSMMDAATCFDKENQYYDYSNMRNCSIDFSGSKLPIIIGICIGIFISTFLCFIF